ncbi:MAG: nucleotide exchange factor GrpE [Promethearchaeota archaeon]
MTEKKDLKVNVDVKEKRENEVPSSNANTREKTENKKEDINLLKKALAEKDEEIQDLKNRLADANKKIDELISDLKWKQAEFENYRKAQEKNLVRERESMVAKIYKDMLPFFDTFDKAVESATTLLEDSEIDSKTKGFLEGFLGLYKNLNSILESKNIKRMDCLGKAFDYNYHEVMMQIEDEDHEEDTIVQEIQKGWLINNKVLRPARVVISKKPQKEENGKDQLGTKEEVTDKSSNGKEEGTA